MAVDFRDVVMDIVDFYKTLPIPVDHDPIFINNLDGNLLAAPASFWTFLGQDTSDVVNGCGTGGTGDFLVPDTVYFLSIKPACKIHDWMFTIFNDEAGFKLANQVFLDNMHRINREKSKHGWLKWLRGRRIMKYYLSVKCFGRLFFYDAHLSLYNDQAIYD